VSNLSCDDRGDGILVQHPMPAHIHERGVFEAITPSKDVDGVTTASFAAMALAGPGFQSAHPPETSAYSMPATSSQRGQHPAAVNTLACRPTQHSTFSARLMISS
jgi:methylenetetrahydrofolate dehydrogenase (NADP+) / methenyltetrahydrofolate cyclohydrolase